MLEKINLIKWLVGLSPSKRNVAYSIIIIGLLISIVYGCGKYIESSIQRDREECLDSVRRLTIERDDIKTKFEASQNYHLQYVEKQVQKYEKLYIKTEELKERLNEND